MPADVRHAIRLFLRRPAFTGALIVTLALGIGATTAIFSLVRAVLLRPLPYAQPDRLMFVWRGVGAARGSEHPRHSTLTGRNVIDWYRGGTSFDGTAVIFSWDGNLDPQMDLVSAGTAERLRGAYVTPNFFELVGVRAAAGRTFDSRDGAGALAPVVISDAFWRRRFGGDAAIVGRRIELMEGRGASRSRPTPHVVAGVLPAGFRFTYPDETEVWAILPWERIRPTNAIMYQQIARLKPGVTTAAAEAELTAIEVAYWRGQGIPESQLQDRRTLVEPVTEHVTAAVRPGLALLVGGAAVVLLIACVNVALLLLALIVDRRREISLRAALGASRVRVFQQMAVEGLLVGAAGGTLGVALAWLLMPAVRAVVPAIVPRGDEMTIDPAALGFAAAASLATAFVCALAPAWHAGRRDVQAGLKQSGGGATSDRFVTAWRRAIVVTQVAVVFVLLVAASLLLHSFWRMRHVDLGFNAGGVFTMEMRVLNPKARDEARMAAFERDVIERVRALPGVEQASMTSAVPLRGVDFFYSLGVINGRPQGANMRPVDRDYFAVMRIPLIAGRTFTDADTASTPTVAVLSASMARELFGSSGAVGQRLAISDRVKAEIVGVVGDVRSSAVTKPGMPAFYLSRAQQSNEIICLVIRPRPGVRDLAPAVREAVRSIDPEQPVEKPAMLDEVVAGTTANERFFTVSTAGFAAVAVLLAIAGLAGVVSRTVTERVREMAIRIALGADAGQLVRMAVGRGMRPVAGGLMLGLAGGWAVSRALAGFLFEVSPLDPLTYGVAALLLAGAAAPACYLPARRAARVEPMAVLKTE